MELFRGAISWPSSLTSLRFIIGTRIKTGLCSNLTLFDITLICTKQVCHQSATVDITPVTFSWKTSVVSICPPNLYESSMKYQTDLFFACMIPLDMKANAIRSGGFAAGLKR